MDALIALVAVVFGLVALSAIAFSFGTDSRDGFANERLRSGLS